MWSFMIEIDALGHMGLYGCRIKTESVCQRMLTLSDVNRWLISLMLAVIDGLFHRSHLAQKPAVSTPASVQSSVDLCRAKYEALRFSSLLEVKSS